MMLRTPPSNRKRARLLEDSSLQENKEVVPATDDERQQAIIAVRQRFIQKDKDLVLTLQAENAQLSERLQAAEASGREFEVHNSGVCTA